MVLANPIYVQCIYGIFGREVTKYTVIHGVCMVFSAGKSPNIQSYTVYVRYFQQRNHQIYGVYTRCWPTLNMGLTFIRVPLEAILWHPRLS